jgi:D-galactarolactone cycloisomerase
MVDLDQSWRRAGDVEAPTDLVRTRKLVAELGEFGVFWVENPLPYPDCPATSGCAPTSRTCGSPRAACTARFRTAALAGARRPRRLPDGRRALDRHAARRTLAELALLKHRHYTPRTWTNGIGLLANLHVAAGVGGGPYFEVPLRPARLDPAAPRLHAGRAASTPISDTVSGFLRRRGAVAGGFSLPLIQIRYRRYPDAQVYALRSVGP